MSGSRVEEAAAVVEKKLRQCGLVIEGEPMVDETTKMASLTHPEGVTGDFAFTIERDNDRGPYSSDTAFKISVKLQRPGKTPEEIDPYQAYSSNAPLLTHVREVVDENLGPALKKYFLG